MYREKGGKGVEVVSHGRSMDPKIIKEMAKYWAKNYNDEILTEKLLTTLERETITYLMNKKEDEELNDFVYIDDDIDSSIFRKLKSRKLKSKKLKSRKLKSKKLKSRKLKSKKLKSRKLKSRKLKSKKI
jgi:hypothetical protein